ncbi:MAG: hypothetical protein ACUVTD_00655 [Nitrososphaerales archaeon]
MMRSPMLMDNKSWHTYLCLSFNRQDKSSMLIKELLKQWDLSRLKREFKDLGEILINSLSIAY